MLITEFFYVDNYVNIVENFTYSAADSIFYND